MTPDQQKAKAILGVVNHYLLHGDYPHLGKSEFLVVAQALLAFSPPLAEVRLNDDSTLDEVVCRGDQLEQMDFNHWFLSLGDVAVWLTAKGKITATYERRSAAPSVPSKEKP